MAIGRCPVTVQVVQWAGDNLEEVISFTGLHPSARKWTWEEFKEVVRKEGLKIFTFEGPKMAVVGDYIIKDRNGELYLCRPVALPKEAKDD